MCSYGIELYYSFVFRTKKMWLVRAILLLTVNNVCALAFNKNSKYFKEKKKVRLEISDITACSINTCETFNLMSQIYLISNPSKTHRATKSDHVPNNKFSLVVTKFDLQKRVTKLKVG